MKYQNKTVREKIINETNIAVGIAVVVLGGFIYLTSPQQRNSTDIELIKRDIEFIKTNHLRHIEGNIENIREDIEYNQRCASENSKSLEKVLTILKERNR